MSEYAFDLEGMTSEMMKHVRADSDLNYDELQEHIRELEELLSRIPSDMPEVRANFIEDLESAKTLLKAKGK